MCLWAGAFVWFFILFFSFHLSWLSSVSVFILTGTPNAKDVLAQRVYVWLLTMTYLDSLILKSVELIECCGECWSLVNDLAMVVLFRWPYTFFSFGFSIFLLKLNFGFFLYFFLDWGFFPFIILFLVIRWVLLLLQFLFFQNSFFFLEWLWIWFEWAEFSTNCFGQWVSFALFWIVQSIFFVQNIYNF